jgi:hypothetical protein
MNTATTAESHQLATAEQAPGTVVTMGFNTLPSFEFMQRTAKMFAASSMVPAAYQAVVSKGYGDKQTFEQNPAAIANCMIALDMSQRMNANPLMIMQNLHIIEGRPSWSSQFIIAAINNCGKFSPLRFDLVWLDEMDANYSSFEWQDQGGRNKKVEVKHSIRIKNARCVAWAIEKATGERLESAPVTMEMAVSEGWYGKNGSKWKSMPDLMMRYRSAAFFGRIYAPELLMGLPSADEVRDIIDVEPQADGSYAMPAAVKKGPLSKSAAVAAAVAPAPAAPSMDGMVVDAEIVRPASPAQADAADRQPGALASASQTRWIKSKIDALQLPAGEVSELLTRAGAESLEALNLDQYDFVRSELVALGA